MQRELQLKTHTHISKHSDSSIEKSVATEPLRVRRIHTRSVDRKEIFQSADHYTLFAIYFFIIK